MREVKYRAWKESTREMLPLIPRRQGGIGMLSDLVSDDDWLVMQYTGLKDKNGAEIFIGDILVLDLIRGDRFSEVKICELREIPVVRFFHDEGLCDGWSPLYAYVGKPDTCLAITGNVHENPELLVETV